MVYTQRFGTLTAQQIYMIKDIFEIDDDELEEWLQDEGEGQVLKILKAFEGVEEQEEYGKPEPGMGPEAAQILERFRGFESHVEKGYAGEYSRALADLAKFLSVKQKAIGYDPRSGMVESPEIAYIKAKMASNW